METKTRRQPKGTVIIGKGAATVKIYPFVRKNGYRQNNVCWHEGGRRRTRCFANFSEAELIAQQISIRLANRQATGKLRFQLHLAKGRTLKRAAADAVCEILLSAVGGESSLATCPIGPFARHYLDEVRKVGSWLSPGATLQQVNRHLSEALETLERAISESDLIRRDRDDPPRWMVERFEANRWKAALRSRLARRPGRAIQSPVKK